jgi:hypothetical protein
MQQGESSGTSGAETLTNAVFIGYMMGCYSLLGRATQAMGDLMAEHVGCEILRYARAHGHTVDSIESVEAILVESELAGVISVVEEDKEIAVTIGECGICPKRVGAYEFDGTACPWPGMLAGILSESLGETLVPSARLVPAETCVIRLGRETSQAS